MSVTWNTRAKHHIHVVYSTHLTILQNIFIFNIYLWYFTEFSIDITFRVVECIKHLWVSFFENHMQFFVTQYNHIIKFTNLTYLFKMDCSSFVSLCWKIDVYLSVFHIQVFLGVHISSKLHLIKRLGEDLLLLSSY